MQVIKYYEKSWRVLKQNKKILLVLLILYLLFLIIGLIYSYANCSSYTFSSDAVKKSYEEWQKTTIYKPTFIENFLYIFIHNSIAGLFRIVTGIFFGILPLYLEIDSGFNDGAMLIQAYMQNGLYSALINFLPISIIEIPALIISSAFGIKIFFSILRKNNRINNTVQSFKDSLLVFIFIIMPALFLAGLIESLLIMIYYFW